MRVLNTLAIVLGILTVATRLPGVLWPKGFREHSMRLVESDLFVRVWAVVVLIIGLLIVAAVLKGQPWLEVVLLVLALLWLPFGTIMLWSPELYRKLATKVILSGELTLRLLCGLGVLIGFLLCFLGIFG